MEIEGVEVLSREALASEDLVELGMRADEQRRRVNPHGIVTYCLDPEAAAVRVSDWRDFRFDRVETIAALAPVCPPGQTAVDYLRLLAINRLHASVQHIQVDVAWTGLKLAQVALCFGADDVVNSKPGHHVSEEEIRRTIRDAGFIPKKRDPQYRSLAIY